MNTSVENYFIEDCGRCPLGGTPECKVHRWSSELEILRDMILNIGLQEECKWGVPCYTIQNKNVLNISAFKEHCAISFFKGSLLKDVNGLLEAPGKNSQATRYLKFTNVSQIQNSRADIVTYISEAIKIEEAGQKVVFKKNPEPIPQELENKFEDDPVFKSAFEALTPGRQRGYIIYFSAPKQSKTRISRIENSIGKILNGEGLHDKFNRKR